METIYSPVLAGPSSNAAGAAEAEDAVRIAQARAELAYYQMVEQIIGGQFRASAEAVPTRLDEPWPRGEYNGVGTEADAENLSSLRARARNLERLNNLAKAVLDRYEENVVGTKINIKPLSGTPEWRAAVKRWLKWWSEPNKCDVRKTFSLGAKFRMAVRARARDGDVGIVLATVPRFKPGPDGKLVPDMTSYGVQKRDPKIQIIEGQQISTPRGGYRQELSNGNRIVDGVEIDQFGAPVAFHVEKRKGSLTTHERVEARDFIFLIHTGRDCAVRGESKFRGSFRLFEQLMGYIDAVVVAARVGASQAMIRKLKDPRSPLRGVKTVTTANGTQQKWTPIEPGAINDIETSEDLVAFNPSQPQQQMPAAVDVFVRLLGVNWGLTIEQVLLKFENISWSTSKAVRAQAEDTARKEREDVVDNGLSRIYRWALSIAVQNEDVTDEDGNPVEAPDDFWAHEWIPPAKPSTDPLKELQAFELALKLGVDAREFFSSEFMGYDLDELNKANVADREERQRLGLPLKEDEDLPANQPAGVEVDDDGKLIVKPGQKSEGPPPLNGVQITAAMDVLAKLAEKTIPMDAAVEMLERLGIAPEKARAIATAAANRTGISASDREFQRSVLLKLLDVQGAKQVVYNLTDVEDLIAQSGLPPEKELQAPLLPVVADSGPLVSGAAIYDPDGDVVGGDVENDEPADEGEEGQDTVDLTKD